MFGKSFCSVDATDYEMITEVTLDNKAIAIDINDTDETLVVVETDSSLAGTNPVVRLWDIGCDTTTLDDPETEGCDQDDEDDEDEDEEDSSEYTEFDENQLDVALFEDPEGRWVEQRDVGDDDEDGDESG
eukprot:TRINITY_DN5291_c0_g1_i2.p2 TRINITY_DN5291_c0_g1~~TRINITY_DN5291_c0_g1_i2.p2  ORF type:complete len:130 (-),score=39.23 TRINITY_DN5291_c0_g1_i2:129-518(-)